MVAWVLVWLGILPLTRAEMHVGVHIKCPLLSDCNNEWDVLKNVSKTPQYQIS
jgi:hypothetical protein